MSGNGLMIRRNAMVVDDMSM